MSITQASVVTLAQTLCYSLGDANEMTRIMGEVMIDLGNDPRAWFTDRQSFPGGTIADPTDTAHLEFPLSLNVVRVLALFFDGRQLSRETVRNLDAMNRGWRDEVGTPQAYVVEQENDRQPRLYPKPHAQASSSSLTTIEGGPTVLYTSGDTSMVLPDAFALPLALLVLGREFMRESPHRDQAFAEIATALGQHYLSYLA